MTQNTTHIAESRDHSGQQPESGNPLAAPTTTSSSLSQLLLFSSYLQNLSVLDGTAGDENEGISTSLHRRQTLRDELQWLSKELEENRSAAAQIRETLQKMNVEIQRTLLALYWYKHHTTKP